MLGWRLGLSAIIIPAVILLFYLDARCGESAPVLLALCIALGLRSTHELVLLLRPRFPDVRTLTCGICVTVLVLAAWAPHVLGAAQATTVAHNQTFLIGLLEKRALYPVHRTRDPFVARSSS